MSEIDPIYQELAARLKSEKSEYIPRILAKLAGPEQARILLELPASSAEEIAEKLNMDKKKVDTLMRDLYEKGCIYYSRSGGNIRFCQDVIELRDAAASNPKFDEELGQEYFDLWDEWTDNEVAQFMAEQLPPELLKVPGARIMAQWKSIKDVPGTEWFDDAREVLIRNADTLAVNPCCCIRITEKPGDEIPREICLVIRKTAEYSVDRGSGRRIAVKEALDILKSLERFALVHTTNNAKSVRRLISNSDERCLAFRFGVADMKQMFAPTRFQPTIDAGKCLGCKTCVETCRFGAAQMKHYPEFGKERAILDAEKCMGCGNCVLQCPVGCRTMTVVRPPEFIPDQMPEMYQGGGRKTDS